MSPLRAVVRIGVLALTAMMGQAMAADLPLEPAPRAQPAAHVNGSPLAAPSATCLEWSDGCRTCQRQPDASIACSNVGIACVPKDAQCTRP